MMTPGNDEKWLMCRTRGRCEKKLVEEIQKKMINDGINEELEYYIPSMDVKANSEVVRGLIGYLFIRSTPAVENCSALANIKIISRDAIKSKEIIRQYIKSELERLDGRSFVVGDRVEVIGGSFQKLIGIIDTINAEQKTAVIKSIIWDTPVNIDVKLQEIQLIK